MFSNFEDPPQGGCQCFFVFFTGSRIIENPTGKSMRLGPRGGASLIQGTNIFFQSMHTRGYHAPHFYHKCMRMMGDREGEMCQSPTRTKDN